MNIEIKDVQLKSVMVDSDSVRFPPLTIIFDYKVIYFNAKIFTSKK